MYHITIDGGTSNTRVSLTKNEEFIRTIGIALGAFGALGQRDALNEEIKKAIDSLLEEENICYGDVECILASGMITSELGICHLEHIEAPAGIKELHTTMEKRILDKICPIPFWFVRGVKYNGTDLAHTDMMRGEETELMGIMPENARDGVYILPGSHSKVIKVNEAGKIDEFSTLLTGEMIKAISQNTILKDAIDLGCGKTDDEYLYKGYEFCRENGINKALFKVRILKNIFSATSTQLYSFFLGIVLADEIREVEKYNSDTVIIGGRHQLKEATASIIRKYLSKKVVVLSDKEVETSVTKGLFRIYKGK